MADLVNGLARRGDVLELTDNLPTLARDKAVAEVSWDLPSLSPGAKSLLDVTVNGARAGGPVSASLVPSPRFIELSAAVWLNNTTWMMAWNIPGETFDMAAATRLVDATKRRGRSERQINAALDHVDRFFSSTLSDD